VKRILATALAVIMLGLLGAGCRQVPVVATSVGAIPVYTGLGHPPQQAGSGTWIKVGHGNWWWWVVTGGAVSAASIKALALAASTGRPSQPAPLAAAALINNPCLGPQSGKPKSGYTKIAAWFVKITGQKLPYDKANEYPVLNCYEFWKIMGGKQVPARLKYLYDCIASILTNGIALSMADEYRGLTGWFGWSWEGGHVVADRGVIKDVKPGKGGWRKCAEG
jgi:hypothetical protein